MKAVLDVHYRSDGATAACVVFAHWGDASPRDIVCADIPAPIPYRAGRFYERELPCLLAVLERAGRRFEALVVDGYVYLKPDAGKGLGRHLYEALGQTVPVVGVAKNPLAIAARFVPVHRGRSVKPLFVSAVGCAVERAAGHIAAMHGSYRIPSLLRMADQAARTVGSP